MPPAVLAANEQTKKQNRSRRFLPPAVAPLSAKTKVPVRSSTRRSVPIPDSPLSHVAIRHAAIPYRADHQHRTAYDASQASAATTKASTPVSNVGWITGA